MKILSKRATHTCLKTLEQIWKDSTIKGFTEICWQSSQFSKGSRDTSVDHIEIIGGLFETSNVGTKVALRLSDNVW